MTEVGHPGNGKAAAELCKGYLPSGLGRNYELFVDALGNILEFARQQVRSATAIPCRTPGAYCVSFNMVMLLAMALKALTVPTAEASK